MNFIQIRKTLLVALLIMSVGSPAAIAIEGGQVGNGGYGVVRTINGEELVVSYDIFLRGKEVYLNPYIYEKDDPQGKKFKLPQDEIKTLKRNLREVTKNEEVLNIIGYKIGHLRKLLKDSQILFPLYYLIENMRDHTWGNQPEGVCKDVKTSDSPFTEESIKLKQIAVRKDARKKVLFCEGFPMMKRAVDVAAVVLHELGFACMKSKSLINDFVGFLFSPDMEFYDADSEKKITYILTQMSSQLKINTFYSALDIWDVAYAGHPKGLRLFESFGFGLDAKSNLALKVSELVNVYDDKKKYFLVGVEKRLFDARPIHLATARCDIDTVQYLIKNKDKLSLDDEASGRVRKGGGVYTRNYFTPLTLAKVLWRDAVDPLKKRDCAKVYHAIKEAGGKEGFR